MIGQMNKARVPTEFVESHGPSAITNVRCRHKSVQHEHSRHSFSACARKEIGASNIVLLKFGLDWAAPRDCLCISVADRADKIDSVWRGVIFVGRKLLALTDVAFHLLCAGAVQAVARLQ